ncbi:MAG: cupin domain-containing protein [Pseudomonadales bacterium]
MAIHHAEAGELVDINDWPPDVSSDQSHTIIINDDVELGRLVLPKGKEIPDHSIASPILIQCVEGTVEIRTQRARQSISAGQLIYLKADDPHSLTALDDAIVLLTIIFRRSREHDA